MRKLFTVLICLVMLSGCALFQKPTGDPALDAQLAADQANLTVAFAEGVFLGLCEEAVISAADCAVGNSALAVWNTDYQLALKLVADYQAGKIDAVTLRESSRSLAKTLATVLRALKGDTLEKVKGNEQRLKGIRAMRLKGPLGKPSGQK